MDSVKVLTKHDMVNGRFTVDPKSRYLEFYGGLGDIFNHIHWLPCYGALEAMESYETATIVVSSHNPHAHELFLWHPNRERFTIINIGFYASLLQDEARRRVGFRAGGCEHPYQFLPVNFFPNPTDEAFIGDTQAHRQPYVVFAAAAGDLNRTVPANTVREAQEIAARRGFNVLVVGRTYKHDFYDSTPEMVRREFRLHGVRTFDLVDKLSVPGVAKLVQGAAGVFTAHSSVCHLAWHQKRPVFVLYDEHAKKTYLPKKPSDQYEGYMFGAGRPGNDHMWFPEYTTDRWERFLKGIEAQR